MGSGENVWAFLVDLAALAGWTFSRFTEPRRVEWTNFLGGLSIPALSFSTVSLDDGGFQQELNLPRDFLRAIVCAQNSNEPTTNARKCERTSGRDEPAGVAPARFRGVARKLRRFERLGRAMPSRAS